MPLKTSPWKWQTGFGKPLEFYSPIYVGTVKSVHNGYVYSGYSLITDKHESTYIIQIFPYYNGKLHINDFLWGKYRSVIYIFHCMAKLSRNECRLHDMLMQTFSNFVWSSNITEFRPTYNYYLKLQATSDKSNLLGGRKHFDLSEIRLIRLYYNIQQKIRTRKKNRTIRRFDL